MKKIFISALCLSILLAGCGQEKQDNKDANKAEQTEGKSNYISDKKLMQKTQEYFESFNTYMTSYIVAAEGGGMSDDIATNIESSGNLLKGLSSEINKFLDKNKIKKEDEKHLYYLSSTSKEFSKFILHFKDEVEKLENGEITEEQYDGALQSLLKDEKFIKADKDLNKSLNYFVDKGLKTDNLDNFYNSDEKDSSDENIHSSEDTVTRVKETFEVNKTINVGPVNLTVNKVELGTFEVTEENSFLSTDLKVGETAQVIVIYLQQENTTDDNVDYYADQAPITTNTGEQVTSDSFDTGLVTEMKGKVKSDGRVAYILKKSEIKDIDSITFIAPSYMDPETYEEIVPEQRIEIPLEK